MKTTGKRRVTAKSLKDAKKKRLPHLLNFLQQILAGNVGAACRLAPWLSKAELKNCKIGKVWALHCLPCSAFQGDTVHETIRLIEKFIGAGWNVNATTNVPTTPTSVSDYFTLMAREKMGILHQGYTFSRFTLLHLACLFECEKVVKLLVEKGAKVGVRTGGFGDVYLYPLHISIMCDDPLSALYLLAHGSSTNVDGWIGNYKFTDLVRPRDHCRRANLRSCVFTPLELIVALGVEELEQVLDQMLETGITGSGADELHLAMTKEAGTFTVLKMLQVVRLKGSIAFDDLMWIKCYVNTHHDEYMEIETIPSFRSLLGPFPTTTDAFEMTELLEAFISLGYNYNLPQGHELIFDIIKYSSHYDRSNFLLEMLLEVDDVRLDVQNTRGLTPVEWVMHCWDAPRTCSHFRGESDWCRNTVGLLLERGADLSGVVIRPSQVRYHTGYKELLQLLYSAGSRISEEMFETTNFCQKFPDRIDMFKRELEELRQWTLEKDKEYRLNLQFLSRIAARRTLQTASCVRTKLENLPPHMKGEILCEYPYFRLF